MFSFFFFSSRRRHTRLQGDWSSDVCSSDLVRPRIGNLLDVVSAVAVIALRGLGVTEFGNFPVIGIEIGLGNLCVATPASGHDVELESILVGAADGVGGVAVGANRQRFIGLGYRGGMHALNKLLFDAMVAVTAGGGQVLRIHRRCRIGGRQFSMRRVATGTGGGHREAALQQALAVDALVVAGNNTVFRPGIEQGSLLAFAMAFGTKIGHVGREGERFRIVLAQNAVRAVAVLAGRSVGVALGMHLAVRAELVLLSDLGVAGSAINRVGDGFAGTYPRGVHLRVTLAAGDLQVT